MSSELNKSHRYLISSTFTHKNNIQIHASTDRNSLYSNIHALISSYYLGKRSEHFSKFLQIPQSLCCFSYVSRIALGLVNLEI